MKDLKKILNFVKLTNNFQKIERDILLLTEQRRENNTEHSYKLALVAWYIIEIKNLDLDRSRVIRYALIHDLVEVYAGDTPLYTRDECYLKSKGHRERKAMTRLKKNFPEFPELHDLIQNYEGRDDAESRFVYAVDKLLPILSIYLDKGCAWKTHNITLEMIINKNSQRVAYFPEVKEYFDMLVVMIRKKPEYFINNNV